MDTLGFGDVGKCALSITHAIEDDRAINIGVRGTGIVLDCQIEIDKREVQVSDAIR